MNILKEDLVEFVANLESGIEHMERNLKYVNYSKVIEAARIAIDDAKEGKLDGYDINLYEFSPAQRRYMSVVGKSRFD